MATFEGWALRDDWFITCTGKRVYALAPQPESIDLMDIAHGLSNVCRFGGQCRHFYSVAQHSVLVSELVPPEAARWGLLHDATEAYIGDIIRPLKRELPDYKRIEKLWEAAIAIRFGLSLEMPASVKHADHIALTTERRDLMPPEAQGDWIEDERGFLPAPGRIMPLPPNAARELFLERFAYLKGLP